MTTKPAAEPHAFAFSAGSGAPLAGYHWQAASGSAATRSAAARSAAPVIMVHGYAEHARRHAGLAQAAAGAGHDVYGFDLQGHGASPGPRAIVDGYGPALAAVSALVKRAADGVGSGDRFGSADRVGSADQAGAGRSVRPVLFGHSMGGAIALEYALANPTSLSALILSAPALLDAGARPAWLLALAGPIARLLPSLPAVKLDAGLISRDPAEVQRYRDDPLIHRGGVPAVTGYSIKTRGEALLARAGDLTVPTLIVHGEADGVMDVEGSRRLAAAASAGTVDLHTFPDGYHELHHDLASSGVPRQVRELELEFLARYAD